MQLVQRRGQHHRGSRLTRDRLGLSKSRAIAAAAWLGRGGCCLVLGVRTGRLFLPGHEYATQIESPRPLVQAANDIAAGKRHWPFSNPRNDTPRCIAIACRVLLPRVPSIVVRFNVIHLRHETRP